MFGSSVNEIRAVLTAEDRNYTKTMTKAMGLTDRLSSGLKKYIGVGAAVAIGERAIGAAMNAVTNSIGSAISRYDQLNRFPQTLNNLGISSEAAKKATDQLSKGLDGLPTTLDSATQGVSRLVACNGDIGKSTKYFLAMNNAIIAGGSSAEIQASAVEQLSQAYSKGKMDMMEWRSIQTAMPGQLKQIGKAMGMSVAELGEGLRSGSVSMDEFMNMMVQLNEEGVDGFKSFADQAMSSVGGIQTSIGLIQSAITRGMANCIGSIDKMLEGNGMPKIGEMAIMLRDKVDVAFKNIQSAMEKVDFKGVVAAATPYWNMFVGILKRLSSTVKTVGGFLLANSAVIAKLVPIVLIAVGAFNTFTKALSGMKALKAFKNDIIETKTEIIDFAKKHELSAKVPAVSSKVMAASQTAFDKIASGIKKAATATLAFASANKVAMLAALGVIGPIVAIGVYMSKTGASADEMAKKINDFADKAASGITAFADKLPSLLPTVVDAGLNLFMGLVDSLNQVIDPLVATMPTIVKSIVSVLPTLIPALLNAAITLFMALIDAFSQIVDALVTAIPVIVDSIVEALPTFIPALLNAAVALFTAIVQAIPKIIPPLIRAIPPVIRGMVKSLWNNRGKIKSAGIQLMTSLLSGISSLFGRVLSSVLNFAKKIPGKIKSGLGSLTSIGKNLVQGLWNGIKSKFTSVTSLVKSLANKLPKAVKVALGIHSPSRVMFGIGEYFSEGFANGIASMSRSVARAAEDIINIPQVFSPEPLAFSIAGYDGGLNIDKYSYADMNCTFVVETNIDGKLAAESIVPHAEPIMEKRQQRINRNRGIR